MVEPYSVQLAGVIHRTDPDWGWLSWMLLDADVRGDTRFGDAYRIVMMWKEEDVGSEG